MYTVDYFINKFSAIPEERWCTGVQNGPNHTHCAIGWCFPNPDQYEQGTNHAITDEGYALNDVLQRPDRVNNGKDERYQQPTPKQRILAALNDIKQLQEAQS